jgi:molecular chaperone GrpE
VTDRRHPADRQRFPVVDKRGAQRPPEAAPPTEPTPPNAEALTEAQKLADERLDQLLRLKADFENFRKRVIREQTELVERASQRIVEQLLPVFDDFERALGAIRTHTVDEALLRGLEIVLERLRGVLEAEGLERVEAQGAFDPHEHEAVSSVPGDVAEPTILEVVRPGYRLKGRTIRPALVHVTTPEQTEGDQE